VQQRNVSRALREAHRRATALDRPPTFPIGHELDERGELVAVRRGTWSRLVDALHVTSMAILASVRRDHRGGALASLGMSLLLLGASAVEVDDRRR
jgi:hypothetical protein